MSGPRIDYGPGDDVVCLVDGLSPTETGFAPVKGEVYLCISLAEGEWCPHCSSVLEAAIDAAGPNEVYCASVFRKALPSDLAVLAGGRVAAPRKLEPV